MKKKSIGILAFMLAVASLAGCSTGGSKGGNDNPSPNVSPKDQAKEKEPVTLTFYSPNSGDKPEDFMAQYGDPIEKKFPYITVNFVHSPDTNPEKNVTDMLAAGESIDVYLNSDINHYRLITPFKLDYDISGLIKTANFDLSKLDDSTVQAVRALSNGGLDALPYKMSNLGLMYNKDLFDKFGQPYPKDGMTWDEVYDLAKAMTRLEGGVQYRGFVTQTYNYMWQNQLGVGFVDPKTEKALYLSDDRWATMIKNLNRFYEIPGNQLVENAFTPISNLFLKDQHAAMYASTIPTTQQAVNWDVVSYPEFSDHRGVGSPPTLSLAYITSISKHKEAAFDAISVLADDEFQMILSKEALGLPVSKNQAIKEAFGQDSPVLKGKNVRALLKNKPAAPFPGTPWDRTAAVELEKIMYQVGKGKIDVNTALRQIDESADKAIQTAKDAQK